MDRGLEASSDGRIVDQYSVVSVVALIHYGTKYTANHILLYNIQAGAGLVWGFYQQEVPDNGCTVRWRSAMICIF